MNIHPSELCFAYCVWHTNLLCCRVAPEQVGHQHTRASPTLPLHCTAVTGQKELAGAYIEGNDLCPEGPKQQATPQPAPQRSSTFGRLFGSNRQTAPLPPPAPACTPQKFCGPLPTVLQRCKATAGCRAVSYDGRCGALKKSAEPRRNRRGW